MLNPVSYEVERLLNEYRQRISYLESRLAAVEQSLSKVWGITVPSTSSTVTGYWCISPSGGIAAATGTWPSLTPTTFTADIYQDLGGTLTIYTSGATCRWFYKDSDPGNRLIPLSSNGDGSFDCLADSCTRVDV